MNILILAHDRLENFQKLLKSCLAIDNANIWISVDKGKSKENNQIIKFVEELKSKNNISFQVSNTNLGLRDGVYFGIDWFFSNVDRGIILEEDLLINNDSLVKLSLLPKIEQFDVINLSCFDSYNSKNSFDISRILDFYMWGWISSSKIWNEFKKIRDKDVFKYYPHKVFIKIGFLAYFQWLFTAVLLKRGDIDSWGYRFLFFLLDSKKNVCRVSPGIAINNGLRKGANFSSLTIMKKALINASDKNLLKHNINQEKEINFHEIKFDDYISAHKIRHNINIYQMLKALFWIIFPFRNLIKKYLK